MNFSSKFSKKNPKKFLTGGPFSFFWSWRISGGARAPPPMPSPWLRVWFGAPISLIWIAKNNQVAIFFRNQNKLTDGKEIADKSSSNSASASVNLSSSLQDLVETFDDKVTNVLKSFDKDAEKIAPIKIRSQEEIMSESQYEKDILKIKILKYFQILVDFDRKFWNFAAHWLWSFTNPKEAIGRARSSITKSVFFVGYD